jgi:hypothetical protein
MTSRNQRVLLQFTEALRPDFADRAPKYALAAYTAGARRVEQLTDDFLREIIPAERVYGEILDLRGATGKMEGDWVGGPKADDVVTAREHVAACRRALDRLESTLNEIGEHDA